VEPSGDTAFEFVKQLGRELARSEFNLPPFPDVALRVRDALANPNVSVDDVARIVTSEPILVTRLLRMANSALLKRGPMEVTDVKVAINRLGFEMVRNAAVSLAVDNSFVAPEGSLLRSHIDRVRKHSVRVGAIAYVLAKRHKSIRKPDEAMLAGLVHDIGVFYILTRVEAYPELFANQQALAELLQGWHTGVGKAIAEAWGFPEPVVEAIDEHELIEREHLGPPDLADVLIVANLIAHLGDSGFPAATELREISACRRLGIDEATVTRLLEESGDELRSMNQALGA